MKKIITHGGSFQTDEVFAVAALRMLFGNLPVVRTREEAEMQNPEDVVVDVGGIYDPSRNRFDHHQKEGAGTRANGIPYSSFGLVWKEYGEKIAGSAEVARRTDETLTVFIDAVDCGVDTYSLLANKIEPCMLHSVVSSFEPSWKHEDTTPGFMQAVEFAKGFLERKITKTKDLIEGEILARESYTHAPDKRVVVMDHIYPWHDVLSAYPEPLYAVYPERGGNKWRLKAVRSHKDSFANRKDLPAAWGGLRDADLAAVSGVSDAVFCHRGLFTAGAKSKEGAIALAKLAADA